MNKAARALFVIGSVLILLVFVCGYFSLASPGIGTRWRQEPSPAKSISRLSLGGAGEVLAQSADGTVYELTYGTPSSWRQVTRPSGKPAIGTTCSTDHGRYLVFPPPGKVASRVSLNCVYIELGYHFEVALLEEGGIWTWMNVSYVYTDLLIMAVLLTALVAGILIILSGLGFKIYLRVKKA